MGVAQARAEEEEWLRQEAEEAARIAEEEAAAAAAAEAEAEDWDSAREEAHERERCNFLHLSPPRLSIASAGARA